MLRTATIALLALSAAAAAMNAPDSNEERLDRAMRTAVRKYPDLIGGPQMTGYDTLSMAIARDGSVVYSGIFTLSLPPGIAGNSLGIEAGLFASSTETAIPDIGPGTKKFRAGQSIAGAGKASRNILVQYVMLPADYDASRGTARVADAVREKHQDLMLVEVGLVAPEVFRSNRRRIMASGGVPKLVSPGSTGSNPMPALPASDTQIINLLTVFMTEDGKIAKETVEKKRVEELESVYPLPVDENAITTYAPPYNSFNPPPVPLEAFNALGLDSAQIGATGYLIVYRKGTAAEPVSVAMPPGVVVRYAWPRRPGEPIGGKAR
jgi:hypothetical protein